MPKRRFLRSYQLVPSFWNQSNIISPPVNSSNNSLQDRFPHQYFVLMPFLLLPARFLKTLCDLNEKGRHNLKGFQSQSLRIAYQYLHATSFWNTRGFCQHSSTCKRVDIAHFGNMRRVLPSWPRAFSRTDLELLNW